MYNASDTNKTIISIDEVNKSKIIQNYFLITLLKSQNRSVGKPTDLLNIAAENFNDGPIIQPEEISYVDLVALEYRIL